ncbi:MAG: hypothetical protein ACKOPQ_11025 [Novosphingobium sp.]|jgi:hypothetical protein
MGKYVMIAQSASLPGREDEYDAWYEAVHMKDICALPGVVSGRRFAATPFAMPGPGAPRLAIYEVETDDVAAFMAEMGRRSAEGIIARSDAMDRSAATLWIYEDTTGQ